MARSKPKSSSGKGRAAYLAAQRSWRVKLFIAVLLDFSDFFVGKIPGVGHGLDPLLAVVAVLLFGWPGLLQAWEMFEPTNQLDAFVPTLTLIALSQRPKPSSY